MLNYNIIWNEYNSIVLYEDNKIYKFHFDFSIRLQDLVEANMAFEDVDYSEILKKKPYIHIVDFAHTPQLWFDSGQFFKNDNDIAVAPPQPGSESLHW